MKNGGLDGRRAWQGAASSKAPKGAQWRAAVLKIVPFWHDG